MKFVNLTPHAITVLTTNGIMSLPKPPEGTVIPRVSTSSREHSTEEGVSLRITDYGEPEGLPESVEGTIFVVSGMVLDAATDRCDFAAPGELVRNDAGQPIGCQGLRVPSWFPHYRG